MRTYPSPAHAGKARHVVVARDKAAYLGRPFEGGLWSFDEGRELLVGALCKPCNYRKRWDMEESFLLRDDVSFRTWRSRDGGLSWQADREIFNLPRLKLLAARKKLPAIRFPADNPGLLVFAGSAQLDDVPGAVIAFSTNRGKTWQGPKLYSCPFANRKTLAQSSSLLRPDGKRLLFLAGMGPDQTLRPVVVAIAAGQPDFQVMGLVPADPDGDMLWPSAVLCPDGSLLLACTWRCANSPGHTLIFRSGDLGRTWDFVSRANEIGQPGHLAVLADGRLLLTYGWPLPPYRILARCSADQGRTWGSELIVREQGGSPDLGSVRTVIRGDGRMVSVYQWNEPGEKAAFYGGVRHIAATIWDLNPA